jgi:methylamine dehydrogenase accessory protein MauD
MSLWTVSLIALWIVMIVFGFLLAGALRQLGLILLRLGDDPGALITESGLDRGTAAPNFVALNAETELEQTYSAVENKHHRLLIFITPSCLSCRELIPGINEVMDTRQDEFDVVVVCRGDVTSCREFARRQRLKAQMLVDTDGHVHESYEVEVTPFAYVLDDEQRVLIRGVANDWRHLESLLEQEGTLELGRQWSPVHDESNDALEPAGIDNRGGGP